jgi:hypothetical protein
MIKTLISKLCGDKTILLKKVDAEERTITAVVLEPNPVEAGETNDLHNDYYTAEEVAKACESFNTYSNRPNLEHELNVTEEVCEILKSFILPVPAKIGDQDVKEGSWIQVWKIHNDELWQMVKDGSFTGFSIGCVADVEEIE